MVAGASLTEVSLAIGRAVGRPLGVECRINSDGSVTTVDVFRTARVGGRQCNHWRVTRCDLGHLHVEPW